MDETNVAYPSLPVPPTQTQLFPNELATSIESILPARLPKSLRVRYELGHGKYGSAKLVVFTKPRSSTDTSGDGSNDDDTHTTTQLVVKSQLIDREHDVSANEFAALVYLRDRMNAGDLPWYYVYMFGSYIERRRSGQQLRCVLLEDCGMTCKRYQRRNWMRMSPRQVLELWYRIAHAVDALERIEMNHGDLYRDNVMVCLKRLNDTTTDTGGANSSNVGDDQNEHNLDYDIKLIDYDSCFMQGVSTDPALGCSDYYRKRFILGLDMNAFLFNECWLLAQYLNDLDEYRESKEYLENGGEATIDRYIKPDVCYPEEIREFLATLTGDVIETNDIVNTHSDYHHHSTSGAAIMQKIATFARTKLNVELFST